MARIRTDLPAPDAPDAVPDAPDADVAPETSKVPEVEEEPGAVTPQEGSSSDAPMVSVSELSEPTRLPEGERVEPRGGAEVTDPAPGSAPLVPRNY